MDELIELIAQRRGITRQLARERIAAMPSGQELLLGLVPRPAALPPGRGR